jgi:repressor LexA
MMGRGHTFALRVRGDSMIDEQIREGDFIIVESCQLRPNGQTVVALVNGSERRLSDSTKVAVMFDWSRPMTATSLLS